MHKYIEKFLYKKLSTKIGKIIDKLVNKGVQIQFLTLHITYNTFKSIVEDDYTKHYIGKEFFMINESLFELINKAKSNNKKVIAVGTTVVRVLEYCFSNSINKTFQGYVDLFINPGYKFKIIDSLLTNFHLPKSNLFSHQVYILLV